MKIPLLHPHDKLCCEKHRRTLLDATNLNKKNTMANMINDREKHKGFYWKAVFLIKVRRNIFTKSLLAKLVDNVTPESNLFTVSAVRGVRRL